MGGVQFHVQWKNGDGDWISVSPFYERSFSGGSHSGAQIQSASVVAPAAARSARVFITMTANTDGFWVAASPVVRRKNGGELIVDGAITGDKITANTIHGGLLQGAGIITKAGQIDDLVVTNAKLANATITGAKIGNLQIDTLHVKDAAITRQWSVSGGNGLSLTFNLPTPARVIIAYNCNLNERNDVGTYYRWEGQYTIKLDGSIEENTGTISIMTFLNNNSSDKNPKLGTMFTKTLAAGNHTISVSNAKDVTNATLAVFAGIR